MAIKIINLEDAGEEVEDVHQEISVMSQMNCPQLTRYYASYVVETDLWFVLRTFTTNLYSILFFH